MSKQEIIEYDKVDAACAFCKTSQLYVVDFVAGNMFPLPDIFAIDCKNCGQTATGYQDSRGWKIDWDNHPPDESNDDQA